MQCLGWNCEFMGDSIQWVSFFNFSLGSNYYSMVIGLIIILHGVDFIYRSAISVLSAVNGSSVNNRWPEDIVWHPDGNRLFAAFTADDSDSQISILNFNAHQEVKFLVIVIIYFAQLCIYSCYLNFL